MKTKAKNRFWDFFLKLVNYFIVPFFIVGIFAMFTMNFSRPTGTMPHFFGISVVRIESGSMVERGFEVGDVILMNQNFDKPLKVGEIIGFYNKKDDFDINTYNITPAMDNSSLVLIDDFEGEFSENFSYSGRIRPESLRNQNFEITFHEIIDVYVSPDGIIFYETQGSNPTSTPDGLIRQDYVIAKYIQTPLLLKMIMTFSITPLGIVLLIILPLSLIVGVEGYNVLKKIYAYHLEGQVFKRKVSYKDDKVREYKISELMSAPRKAYFWVTTKKSEKEQVFRFLYQLRDESNKKEVENYQKALKAKEIFENKGPLEYFRFWHLTVDGYFDKKEIVKFKKQYENMIIDSRKK